MLLQTLQRALWQSKPYRSDLLHGICGAHLRLSTDSVSVAGGTVFVAHCSAQTAFLQGTQLSYQLCCFAGNEQSTASTSSSSVDAEMVGRGPGEPSTSGRVQAKEELVDKVGREGMRLCSPHIIEACGFAAADQQLNATAPMPLSLRARPQANVCSPQLACMQLHLYA